MELEQIKAIVAMMKDNDLSEFSMEQDGLKIRIKRGPEEFQQTVTSRRSLRLSQQLLPRLFKRQRPLPPLPHPSYPQSTSSTSPRPW